MSTLGPPPPCGALAAHDSGLSACMRRFSAAFFFCRFAATDLCVIATLKTKQAVSSQCDRLAVSGAPVDQVLGLSQRATK